MKWNAGSHEHVGDFGDRTGGTVGKPVSGHGGSVLESVECFVVDGCFRLKIQHNDGDICALHQRQDCVRESVGCDVEKQHVDVFAAALMASFERTRGRIHQAKID